MTLHGYCIQLLDRQGLQTAMQQGERKDGENLLVVLEACLSNPNFKRKLKEGVANTFIACLYTKKNGVYYLQEPLAVRAPDAWKLKAKELGLTNQEINVLEKLKAGLSTKEVAAALNLSEDTVETHRKNIFEKLEVNKITAVFHILDK